jgi:hypothetical protein
LMSLLFSHSPLSCLNIFQYVAELFLCHPICLFLLNSNNYSLPSILALSILFTWLGHCNQFSSHCINMLWIPSSFLKISYVFLSLGVLSFVL